jgi:DUF917 family protein
LPKRLACLHCYGDNPAANDFACRENDATDIEERSSAMFRITPDFLERLAIGAGILGTGGGGNPYNGKLMALRQLSLGQEIEVVHPSEVPDTAVVTSVGGMGAPTVGVERVEQGEESLRAMRALEKRTGTTVEYVVPSEIGGGNSIMPIIVGAQTGIQVIDGDGMGRAFPELQMETYVMYGIPPTPGALADHSSREVVFSGISDPKTLERYARVVTVQMGGGAGYAFPIMTGAELKRTVIPGTLSLAASIGDAVLAQRAGHGDPVGAVIEVTGGRLFFTGKISDVERRLEGGFIRGGLKLDGSGVFAGQTLLIDFQNENLIARTGDGEILAIVPDLICIVDEETAEPITTEILRYGLRVAVIGIPAPAALKTERALAYVGPEAFGYPDVAYIPMPGIYGGPDFDQGGPWV